MKTRTPDRALKRELPLVIILVAFAALAAPLIRGVDSIDRVRRDLNRERAEWLVTALEAVAEGVGREPEAASLSALVPAESVERILESPSFRELARFDPELATQIDIFRDQLARQVDATLLSRVNLVRSADASLATIIRLVRTTEERRAHAYRSVVVFVLVLLAGFVALYGYQTFRLHRLRVARRVEEDLAMLSRRVQEHERSSIARDLHDGASQELALARMIADQVDDESTRGALRGSLERAMDEIKLVRASLAPTSGRGDTVAEVLMELVAYLNARHGTAIELRIGDSRVEDLSRDATVHLYRIAREALSNVVRHAGASRAIVEVRRVGEASVSLTVSDDGVGIDGEPEGAGRKGMRERTALLGGTIEWTTPPTGGTEVRVQIPVTEEAEWER